MKHSGKTTLASLSANLLDYPFFDTDQLILPAISPLSVREYYKEYGQNAFIDMEAKVLSDAIALSEKAIISLGGGVCNNEKAISLMKENGKIVFLQRNEKENLEKVLKHGIPPFLDPNDVEGSFHRLYIERTEKYLGFADLVIEVGPYRDKKETAEFVIEKLKENGYV